MIKLVPPGSICPRCFSPLVDAVHFGPMCSGEDCWYSPELEVGWKEIEEVVGKAVPQYIEHWEDEDGKVCKTLYTGEMAKVLDVCIVEYMLRNQDYKYPGDITDRNDPQLVAGALWTECFEAGFIDDNEVSWTEEKWMDDDDFEKEAADES